jgi:hypothetical protein
MGTPYQFIRQLRSADAGIATGIPAILHTAIGLPVTFADEIRGEIRGQAR